MKINTCIYIYIYISKTKYPKNKYPFVQGLNWPKNRVNCSIRSDKCETIVFDFKGQRIYLIFRLSTNFIDYNDETGHFVKHIFLVLILKVNVKNGGLILLHPKKVSWAGLIQSGEAENFLFKPIALNLFPLVKASKKGFPYNPELGLADLWDHDNQLSLIRQPIRNHF